MNTREGTRRILLLGKCTTLFGVLATAIIWGLFVTNLPVGRSMWSLVEMIRPLMSAVIACGAILWGIGWIVEGLLREE